ncbi:hypothetical protein ACQE3E_06745 [Methylomonas sp. MED-D]|uniref:hypothetical protein n=1 Tax=Methylomonas sp. MED-D TaxID=3418768 RepID=UPI003D051839
MTDLLYSRPYAVYEITSGSIVQTGTALETELDMQAIGWGEAYAVYAGEADRAMQYILAGEPVSRPAQATAIDKTIINADGVDVATITGAPTDAIFTAVNLTTGDGASGSIGETDGFSSAVAGTIVLTISKWPYLDWSVAVEAI